MYNVHYEEYFGSFDIKSLINPIAIFRATADNNPTWSASMLAPKFGAKRSGILLGNRTKFEQYLITPAQTYFN